MVVPLDEQQGEGLQAGEEEVAQRRARDHQHVGGDRGDVADRAPQRHLTGVLVEDELRVGDRAGPPRRLPRPLRGVDPGRVDDHGLALLPARAAAWAISSLRSTAPTASGLCPPRSGSGTVRQSSRATTNPGIARTMNAARQSIALATSPLTMNPKAVPTASPTQDVGPDPSSLGGREVIAGERGDRRARARRHRPQRQPGQQQAAVAAREGAEQRGQAPEHDGERQQRHPLGAVDQQPDRHREHRADQQRDRAQQPDIGVVDVQRGLELWRDRAHRRGIGAVERQHEREQDDHASARRPARALDDLPPDQARHPPHELREKPAIVPIRPRRAPPRSAPSPGVAPRDRPPGTGAFQSLPLGLDRLIDAEDILRVIHRRELREPRRGPPVRRRALGRPRRRPGHTPRASARPAHGRGRRR